MMGGIFFALAVLALSVGAALAGSTSETVPVSVRPQPLHIDVVGVNTECSWPPGTVILQYAPTGGNGAPLVYTLTGDTADFAMSGSSLVVGPSGIAPANCGKVNTVTVTATQ
jgi:hypothetical protein